VSLSPAALGEIREKERVAGLPPPSSSSNLVNVQSTPLSDAISIDDDSASTSSSTCFEEAEVSVPERLATIEVFGGSARLTKALCEVGFDSVAIDYRKSKDRPVGKTIWCDLTVKAGVKEFRELVDRLGSRLVYVHFAPPCGTASRAREKRRLGPLDPKPLRSVRHPDGLPSLAGADWRESKQRTCWTGSQLRLVKY